MIYVVDGFLAHPQVDGAVEVVAVSLRSIKPGGSPRVFLWLWTERLEYGLCPWRHADVWKDRLR
jgi:hypothetical protein